MDGGTAATRENSGAIGEAHGAYGHMDLGQSQLGHRTWYAEQEVSACTRTAVAYDPASVFHGQMLRSGLEHLYALYGSSQPL